MVYTNLDGFIVDVTAMAHCAGFMRDASGRQLPANTHDLLFRSMQHRATGRRQRQKKQEQQQQQGGKRKGKGRRH